MLWMTFSQTPYTADFIVIIGVLFYNVKEMSGKSLKNMLLKSAENYLKKVFVNLLKTLDRMGGGGGRIITTGTIAGTYLMPVVRISKTI